MSLYSSFYGLDMDQDGDMQMDPMTGAPAGHGALTAPGHSGGTGGDDYIMNDLSTDMLPFDLDLNSIPDSDVAALARLSASQGTSSVNPLASASSDSNLGYNFPYAYNTNNDNSNPITNQIVIGAGPLPTSFGLQLAPGQGSTLTEFTKRRNWSQRVIEELRDFLHILSPDGRLLWVSPSTKSLLGHEREDLVGKTISNFIHPDDSHMFIREFNESIATGNPLRFFYRFRKSDDTYTILECHGHPHLSAEPTTYGSNNNSGVCLAFFMMARPYPTKNAALLDSFLEHKVENERLRKRIAELKREELEDLEGQPQFWVNSQSGTAPSTQDAQMTGRGPTTSMDPTSGDAPSADTSDDAKAMPPPAKPSMSNTALTRQNLDEVLATSRPDSIKDKMARYEGATHIETIEMLTGLRYRDGERSKGISTGDQSPTLIRGDAGIPIQVDKDGRPTQSTRSYNSSPYGDHGDKKKKLKVADEYVCTDCGTLDSPEWRKGPSGPKTLCNACGLRWAKKEKKRGGPNNDNDNGNGKDIDNSSSAVQGSIAGLHMPMSNNTTNSQTQLDAMTAQSNMSGTAPMLAPSTDGAPPALAPQ